QLVGCRQDGLKFRRVEERHERPLVALGRNGENPLDQTGVFGMLERSIREEGVDSGKASVTRPDAIASVSLGVFQEGAHDFGIDIVKADIGWFPASPLLTE